MKTHSVRTHRSTDDLPMAQHLAYAIAEVAVDPVSVTEEVTEMVINRVIDNAAVAAASLTRAPVVAARSQAADHPYDPGASVAGIEGGFSPEWAAWANGVAVRELDFHDTFLGAEYSHPGDNIPPILAVAQHVGRKGNSSRPLTGVDIVRGIATGYEIQIDLASAISLHAHKIDHVAHLAPSAAAGIGTLLDLDADTVYQAVGQALHTSTATRQSRKGLISNWKAYAPAFAGKVAVESVDRAIRGQTSPSPIYEGEDGVIAWLLGGPGASYEVSLPEPGEAKRAILDSYTKEHSAEYQAQAWIDLAHRLSRIHPEVADPDHVVAIVIQTSHHTHSVIGSGANDPQKYDPYASRETLDHSLPYIFAVALQSPEWHHERSFAPERARRDETVALWRKIITTEDPEWTRRYHSPDHAEKAFGGRVDIMLTDGRTITDEIAVADAHPLGRRPFGRQDYIAKFRTLAAETLDPDEIERFLDVAQRLPELSADRFGELNIVGRPELLASVPTIHGLF